MKSGDRRAAIVDRLADFVLAEGMPAASLRPLARAAGTSDRMLLYYFNDKAEVIAATLERVAARLTALLIAQTPAGPLPPAVLRRELWAILSAPEVWPYMCVWMEVAALAGRDPATYGAIGDAIGRGFLAWGEALLEGPAATRRAEAVELLVTLEGMMVLKSIGLEDLL